MKLYFLSLLLLISPALYAQEFVFTFDPIDIVIPCHEKDTRTLELVIDGLKKNAHNIRRIIVVSSKELTHNAEWFDERHFPFTKETVALEIFKTPERAQQFMSSPQSRIGWIYQQLLKVYSMFVIPNISPNLLIVDADAIFLKPIYFQDPETGAGLYAPGWEHHQPYFDHNSRVLPGWKKIFPAHSGISHHMLFQRDILEHLFTDIRQAHINKPYDNEPWKVFCNLIDHAHITKSCMCIEYELYFNYVFERSQKVKIREIRWDNIPLRIFDDEKNKGWDMLACHAYMQ